MGFGLSRANRLSELADKIGESVLSEANCAKSVPSRSVDARTVSPNLLKGNELKGIQGNGGGGIRTRIGARQNHHNKTTKLLQIVAIGR